MGRWATAWCMLCVLVGVGGTARAEGRDPGRAWGLGWDDGVTVRRFVGPWELGLSAGPYDHRGDDATVTTSPDLPDSLNGTVVGSSADRRESGFVRLQVARPVAAYRSLSLSAVAGATYTWTDESSTDLRFYTWDGDWRRERRDVFSDSWRVTAGARLSWFPVPFLSLETEFGLAMRWVDATTSRYTLGPGETEPELSEATASDHYFDDFGPYSLTSDVQIVVWF